MAGNLKLASASISDDPFRLLVQSILDYAIYMLDPNGYVTSWNAGAERIKGFEAGEIIGQHFSTFYTVETRRFDGYDGGSGYHSRIPGEGVVIHKVDTTLSDRLAQVVDPDNNGKNIRAWTGMSFAYHMLAMYEKELECCAQALESDRSDPKLWLLYSFALKSAGREEEALSSMNDAYDAYVRAGKPEELREVFADVQSTTQRPCRQRMAQ